ncbi:MAG TPA: site-specific integrase [Bryobacteraceae bacterium]|nr:site-specific integrase [Bryobacteraceae bacterium]
MAPKYSKSVLSKIRVYFNSMLDEAVELEMLPKNPAGKLAVPKPGKRKATKHLTPEEIPQILFHLSDRDLLIVRMFLVLGLRPGEMFALRWNGKEGNSLRIDSSITDGMEVETKPRAAIPSFGSRPQSTRNWNSGAVQRPLRRRTHSFSPQAAAPPSTRTIFFSAF